MVRCHRQTGLVLGFRPEPATFKAGFRTVHTQLLADGDGLKVSRCRCRCRESAMLMLIVNMIGSGIAWKASL